MMMILKACWKRMIRRYDNTFLKLFFLPVFRKFVLFCARRRTLRCVLPYFFFFRSLLFLFPFFFFLLLLFL